MRKRERVRGVKRREVKSERTEGKREAKVQKQVLKSNYKYNYVRVYQKFIIIVSIKSSILRYLGNCLVKALDHERVQRGRERDEDKLRGEGKR